jgi:hypothetical protein
LVQVNTHIDPIGWHEGGSLQDISVLLNALARAVASRVEGKLDEVEPIGLLTHHLRHDEAVWHFCETLLARLAGHSSVRIVDPVAMFVGAQTAAI